MALGHLRLMLGPCLLAVLLPLACDGKGKSDDASKPLFGLSTIEDEVYILPPLSEFEPFPEAITTDLAAKCKAEGLTLTALKRTKGNGHQSIYADFSGGAPANPRTPAMAAFRILGTNFLDVARIVVALPGEGPGRYWIATGRRLGELLHPEHGTEPISEDKFWDSLSQEISPEPPSKEKEGGATLKVRSD